MNNQMQDFARQTLKDGLAQLIEKYGFICEVGPIENCVEWLELKNLTSAIHLDGEGFATEVYDQVHNGASISDIIQLCRENKGGN